MKNLKSRSEGFAAQLLADLPQVTVCAFPAGNQEPSTEERTAIDAALPGLLREMEGYSLGHKNTSDMELAQDMGGAPEP